MTREYERWWKKCVRCGHVRPPHELTKREGDWTCIDTAFCDSRAKDIHYGKAKHMNGSYK